MWDDHDEQDDPNNERVLDEGRETLSTTWLDAEPQSIMKMPEDTISPLLVALALMMLFVALIFQWMWVALAGIGSTLFATYYWLWPRPEEELA